MDRYVQICRCFRDEDLRADRQPEFTQVDVEMSFARPGDDLRRHRAADAGDLRGRGPTIETPFQRMPYSEAIAKFGSDKPDLRCGMPIQDLRELFRESSFRVFKEIVAGGGTVRGFVIRNAGGYSRSEVDGIVDQAKQLGAAGLVWARRAQDGAITSSIMKALGRRRCADARLPATATASCCSLRRASRRDVEAAGPAAAEPGEAGRAAQPDEFAFTWVVDFPLLEWDAEDKRYVSMHHPFTSPHDEDVAQLDSDPGASRARRTTSC
jgi:aspartyl-tRNA synthetase